MIMEIIFLIFLPNVAAFELDSYNNNSDVAKKLRKSAFIDGDFIIGALFSIHSSPLGDTNPLECGPINSSEGIELVEAAFFAIDTINMDKKLLPGIKLGINIKDDCEDERVALYQTMHMIKEPKSEYETSNSSSVIPVTCTNKYRESPLIGMIGTMTKLNMLHYENLLKLFKIPQIGYSTSLSELISPYFYLSVVPSDFHLANLIIKILRKFNWTYIAVAYTDQYFGMNGKYFLEQWVSHYNICISSSVHVPRPKENIQYTHSVKQLFKNYKAKVIVCFCDETTLKVIFQEMRNLRLTGKYLILNSYEWSISEVPLNEYKKEAEGMLMIALRNNLAPRFEEYVSRLHFRKNERNPWFDEYLNSKYAKLNIKSNKLNTQNVKIAYLIKSIYAFAQGLHEMSLDICGSSGGQCLKKKPFDTSRYMEFLTKLNFHFFNKEDVEFIFHGSPQIGRFDIYNLQNIQSKLTFVKVADYNCHPQNNVNEDFIFGKIKWPKGGKINSICSEECSLGHAQINDRERLCCWQCVPCGETEYVADKSKCTECPQGHLPNNNKTGCVSAPTKYLKWNDPRSLIAASASSCAIILALMTADIFARHGHTPVIKSSSAALDYIILSGVIALSGCNFILVIKPNTIVCALAKTLPSVAVSLIYIPVIFKTLQIFHVLKAMKNRNHKFPSMIASLKAQMTILNITVIAEMIIMIGFMFIREKPIIKKSHQSEPETVIYLQCVFERQHWIDIVIIPLHLIMTYYGIKIRKMSHNFHEAKFLAIFAFVQTSTNLILRIVYISSNFQIISMFIGFTLDSFVTLLFLFFPKLYIIIWRPEINTDDNFKSFIAQYYSYQ